MKRLINFSFLIITCSTTVLSSCTTTGAGAMTGAMFGGVIGSSIGGIGGGYRGSNVGTLVGMAAGAATGAAIGAAAEAKEREAEAEFIREERESVREHYRSLGINNAKPDDTDDVYGSPRRSDASGYSSDPVYDDRIELTPSTNNPTPTTCAGSTPTINISSTPVTTTVPAAVVEVSETSAVITTPIKIENARFINEQNTTHIAKGELVKISFEIRNMSDAAINNVVPVVKETTGNKHLLISPSTLVERLAAHKAIRYTAYVSAEKTLKTGTAHFVIAVYSDNNQISNTIEFDVTLN